MQTRSQSKKYIESTETKVSPETKVSTEKKALYEVDIDFDEASREWRSNKKSIGNGQFKYKKWKLNSLNLIS